MGIRDVCKLKDGYAERCLLGHSFSGTLEARDQHLSLHFRGDACDSGRCIHVDGSTGGWRVLGPYIGIIKLEGGGG